MSANTAKMNRHPFERSGLGKPGYVLESVDELRGPIRTEDGCMVGAPGQPMGTCDHCGTGIVYRFHIRSSDGVKSIVGSTCVEKTYREYDPLNIRGSQLVSQVKREKNRMVKEAKARAARKTIERDHKDVHDYLIDYKGSNRFFASLSRQLTEKGKLTTRQIEAFREALKRETEREEERAQRQTEEEARAAREIRPPEGRQPICGKVLTLKWKDNGYYGSSSLKMLIQVTTEQGEYRLWGTVPSAAIDDIERGSVIDFTATITPKEKGFGFFSRPAKASVAAQTDSVAA